MASDGGGRSNDVGRLDISFSDDGMENINAVGPSESRIADVRRKIERLKGMGSTIREAEALLGPKPKRSPSAVTAKPGSGYNMTTSGVGGSWNRPKEVETYKPSGSGSWGVFERPRDMSKAMGGGRRVGVGAPETETEEERKAKAMRTAQLLASYREGLADEDAFEREHQSEIEEAICEGRQYMAVGDLRRCVETLEPFWRNCSAKSDLGGRVGLELGMALDAYGDRDAASRIYGDLARSRSPDVVRKAKQLQFGLEAMEMLGVEAEADITGFSILPELEVDRQYSQDVFNVGKAAAAPVDSKAEALAVLRVAASDLSRERWTATRVTQALAVLTDPANDAVRPKAPITGVWRLVLRKEGSRVQGDERSLQTVTLTDVEGAYRVARRESLGIATSEREGTWVPAEDRRTARLVFDTRRVGPLRMLSAEGPAMEQRILVLDQTLMVTMEPRRGAEGTPLARLAAENAIFYVWTQ